MQLNKLTQQLKRSVEEHLDDDCAIVVTALPFLVLCVILGIDGPLAVCLTLIGIVVTLPPIKYILDRYGWVTGPFVDDDATEGAHVRVRRPLRARRVRRERQERKRRSASGWQDSRTGDED